MICRCTVVNQQDRAFLYFMIPFAGLMAVAVPIIVLWTRMSLPKYVGRWNRKKGPPESGQTVSLVLTDVEGSTELWEAFQEVSFQYTLCINSKTCAHQHQQTLLSPCTITSCFLHDSVTLQS